MLFDSIVKHVLRRALNGAREPFCLSMKQRMISIIRNTWQEKGMEVVSQQRKASKHMDRETLGEPLCYKGNFEP